MSRKRNKYGPTDPRTVGAEVARGELAIATAHGWKQDRPAPFTVRGTAATRATVRDGDIRVRVGVEVPDGPVVSMDVLIPTGIPGADRALSVTAGAAVALRVEGRVENGRVRLAVVGIEATGTTGAGP